MKVTYPEKGKKYIWISKNDVEYTGTFLRVENGSYYFRTSDGIIHSLKRTMVKDMVVL